MWNASFQLSVAPVHVDGANIQFNRERQDIDESQHIGLVVDQFDVAQTVFEALSNLVHQRGFEGFRTTGTESFAEFFLLLNLVFRESSTELQSADVVGLDGVVNDVGQKVHFFEEVLAKRAQRLLFPCVHEMRVPFEHGGPHADACFLQCLSVHALSSHATQAGVARSLTHEVLVSGRRGSSRNLFDVGPQLHGNLLLVRLVLFNRFNVVPQRIIGFTKTGVGVLHPVVFIVVDVLGRVGFVACHVATTFPGPTPKTAR